MTNKVSIIIPVYNGEKYVSRMLNCIKDQTYQNIQVIIAYDTKSTDKTLEILKSYQHDFPYELIIDEACDSSTGEARNRGYKLANGDFVIFIDADDYICPKMISSYAYGLIQNANINISTGNYASIENENVLEKSLLRLKKKNEKTFKNKCVSNNFVFSQFWKGKCTISIWNYLIRKSFLDNINLKFQNLSNADDVIFLANCLKKSPEICVCNYYGYVYINRENSLSHFKINSPSFFLEKHKPCKIEFEKLLGIDFPSEKIKSDIVSLITNQSFNTGLPLQQYLEDIQKRGIRKIPTSSEIDFHYRAAIFVYNLNPKWFYYISRLHKTLGSRRK